MGLAVEAFGIQSGSIEFRENSELQEYAGSTWRCIRQLCRTPTGLPDDRIIQENGSCRYSGETSITNIGLLLPATIAAKELGFISDSDCLKVLDGLITTIEQLPRVGRGFFYTWYDTEKLQGLRTSKKSGLGTTIVSSVDLGWLLAGMMTVGGAYPEFRERTDDIIRTIDLPFLYDPECRLFWGVYDGEAKQPTGHHYDLLLSEARLMTYIAMAKYGIPEEAFFNLGRGAIGDVGSRDGGVRTISSWEANALTVLSPEILVPESEWSPEGLKLIQDKFVDAMVSGDPSIGTGGFIAPCEGPSGVYEVGGIRQFSIQKSNGGHGEAPVAAFLALSRRPGEVIKFLAKLRQKMPKIYSDELGFADSFDRCSGLVGRSRLAPDSIMSFLAVSNYLFGDNNRIRGSFASQIEKTVAPLLATEKYSF